MAKRSIIKIDEGKCNGCGLCVPDCPEGAIQMIDGKARLISDLFCDGLGACMGSCPQDAISVEEREAEAYDEKRVMENIIKQGPNVIKAHLEHLQEHGEKVYLKTALEVLREQNVAIPEEFNAAGSPHPGGHACPGIKMMNFEQEGGPEETAPSGPQPSALRQWPVQLHLVSPIAPYFQEKDVVLAADCVAFSLGDFHTTYLKGKSLAIACPKLDEGQERYIEKITSLIDDAKINTLTVMIMEVPCCRGLLMIAQKAAEQAKRKVPIKLIVVGIKGNIKEETWV